MLAGNLASIGVGGIIATATSYIVSSLRFISTHTRTYLYQKRAASIHRSLMPPVYLPACNLSLLCGRQVA